MRQELGLKTRRLGLKTRQGVENALIRVAAVAVIVAGTCFIGWQLANGIGAQG